MSNCNIYLFIFKIKKLNIYKTKFKFLYFLLFVFLLEWFLNHPSMRYGGYVLIGLPLIIFSASLLKDFEIPKKKFFR